jgi:hypothetical protein
MRICEPSDVFCVSVAGTVLVCVSLLKLLTGRVYLLLIK